MTPYGGLGGLSFASPLRFCAVAARMAEAVFTAQQTLEGSIAFYSDLKGRLSKYARSTGGLKILPRVFPVVGRTRQEASDKFEQLQSLLEPLVGLDMLADLAGVEDIRTMPVDALIADLPETEGGKSRRARFLELAARENLTLRQLYQRVAGARGHWQVVGSARTLRNLSYRSCTSRGTPLTSGSVSKRDTAPRQLR
ncbi:LLM class flavin-dependent oxidoreductase [Rhizobium sp. S96]|nr:MULTISPECIES: LLM class flavin-dependent oxidoreductase [unclassified Rhizobium]MDM9623458.1 LLM class flavin-dependent oxidoreductase [Rhizobium sp. S96]